MASGLIILEFNDTETLRCVALRSPNPHFGGRKPLDIDNVNDYNEDAENYQYNLIFKAWGSQFDKKRQEYYNFKPADKDELILFQECIEHANKLGDLAESKFKNDFENYFEKAKQNIEKWAGIGIITR